MQSVIGLKDFYKKGNLFYWQQTQQTQLVSVFNPLSLFASGEQGFIYDPSDMSTLFQDSAGTIPVTAVEQPVGLMLDKSKGLALGPEMVVNGTFGNDVTGWDGINAGATMTWQPSGSALFRNVADFAYAQSVANLVLITGRLYKVSFDILAINHTSASIHVGIGGSGNLISSTIPKSYTYYHLATGNSTFQIRPTSAGVGTIQIDNISVKLLAGNHAYQSTLTKRPMLSSRVNLLTWSEDFANGAWSKTRASIAPNAAIAPDGTMTADKLVENTENNSHHAGQFCYTAGIANATGSIFLKAAERGYAMLRVTGSGNGTPTQGNVGVDLTTGAVTGSSGVTVFGVESAGNGWWRVYANISQTTTNRFDVQVFTSNVPVVGGALSNPSYQGDGVSGIYVWGGQVNYTYTAYQRITTATNYDTVGFPLYLKGDGIDDFMYTGNIDFTGTDKMTVWAGVRKLDDTGRMIAELSHLYVSNGGSFYVVTGNDAGVSGYTSAGRGDTAANPGQVAKLIASGVDDAVLTITHNIAGDLSTIKRNGVAGTPGTGDKGAGNFGNYPMYLLSRGGGSLFFNGNLYSLIIRGAATDAAGITNGEKWTAKRIGVTLP